MNGQQIRTVRARISNLREAADALERVLDQVEGKAKPKRKKRRGGRTVVGEAPYKKPSGIQGPGVLKRMKG